MVVKFLSPQQLQELPFTAETRQTVEHFQRVLATKEYGPLLNPATGELGIAELPQATTENVEAIADEFRAILIYQSITASNPCSCATFYQSFERLKADIAASIKKAERRRLELLKVEEDQKRYFPGAVPLQFATAITAPPCEYCGRHRVVPALVAFSAPGLRQKIISLLFGGHIPLNYLVYYLSLLDKMIYNEEVIPDAKKKMVAAFLVKAGITTRMDALYQWLRGEKPSASTNSAASMPKTLPPSTGTTDITGDSARPTWTPDLPPSSDDSTLTNGSGNADLT